MLVKNQSTEPDGRFPIHELAIKMFVRIARFGIDNFVGQYDERCCTQRDLHGKVSETLPLC